MIKQHNKNRGFTLIELLVVISIIGLLSSIVLASLNQAKKKAQATTIIQQFTQLRNAIEMYRLQNGYVPCQYRLDNTCSANQFSDYGKGIETNDKSGSNYPLYRQASSGNLFTSYLSPFIPAIPHAPLWSNNGDNYYFVYKTNLTEQQQADENPGPYTPMRYTCGDTPYRDYMLIVKSDTADPGGILGSMKMTPQYVHILNEPTKVPHTYCITSP